MIRRLLVLLGLSFAAVVTADSPQDYGYGAHLQTAGDAAVYELVIPPQAYRQTQYPDQRDLRVFNAAGQAVASTPIAAVRREQPQADEREELSIYPLHRDRRDGSGSLSLTLNEAQHQVVVQRPIALRHRISEGYLLDRGESDSSIDLLFLETDADTRGVARLRVFASDDMHQWRALGRGSLVSLRHGKKKLRRGEIKLKPSASRFIKLLWLDPDNRIPLIAAQARVHNRELSVEKLRLPIEAERMAEGASYHFSLPHGAAVTALQVLLPESNTLVSAKLWWRRDKRGSWRHWSDHALYRIEQQGEVFNSEPFVISVAKGGEWRLTLSDVAAVGERELQFFALAEPQRLLFLARGEAPFQLVWGRADMEAVGATDVGLKKLLKAGIKPRSIDAMSEPQPLAGESALQSSAQWQRWLLWCVLGAAMLLLMSMAVKLLRQIDRQNSP